MSGSSSLSIFYLKGGKDIQSNIIYNFNELREILIEKTVVGAYYLILDDIYFEKIEKNMVISRDICIAASKVTRPFKILKYISIEVKDKYTTKQIYDFIQVLRKENNIIATIFNADKKEIFLLYISNRDDSGLEKKLKMFTELEVN